MAVPPCPRDTQQSLCVYTENRLRRNNKSNKKKYQKIKFWLKKTEAKEPNRKKKSFFFGKVEALRTDDEEKSKIQCKSRTLKRRQRCPPPTAVPHGKRSGICFAFQKTILSALPFDSLESLHFFIIIRLLEPWSIRKALVLQIATYQTINKFI